MNTIEFQTCIEDGIIHIPQEYQQALQDIVTVKVVVEEVPEKKMSKNGIIARLQKNPKTAKDVDFLTREESHDRSL